MASSLPKTKCPFLARPYQLTVTNYVAVSPSVKKAPLSASLRLVKMNLLSALSSRTLKIENSNYQRQRATV